MDDGWRERERWREMGKDKRIEEYEETERGKEGGKEERTEGRQRTKETKRGRKKPISIFDTVALPNAFSIFIFFGVVPTGTLFFFYISNCGCWYAIPKKNEQRLFLFIIALWHCGFLMCLCVFVCVVCICVCCVCVVCVRVYSRMCIHAHTQLECCCCAVCCSC